MKEKHKKTLPFRNPLIALAGQPYYEKEPTEKEILEELLNGMAEFKGACWSPVNVDGGYSLMLNQCPKACGDVWRIHIQNRDVAMWLTNEINQRRNNLTPISEPK